MNASTKIATMSKVVSTLGRMAEPVQQGLVPGLQHRDRGAQLMRDVGDQVTAQLLLPIHRVGHVVERDGKFTQLARAYCLIDLARAKSVRSPPPARTAPGHHGRSVTARMLRVTWPDG